MRNIAKLGLFCLLAAGCRASSDTPKGIGVADLQIIPRAAAWCSCQVRRREAGGSGGSIFISTYSPKLDDRVAWMNLNGEVLELPQKQRCTFITPGDKGLLEQCAFLRSGYLVVTQMMILSRRENGYTTSGIMKVSKDGLQTILEVEGSCGCSA